MTQGLTALTCGLLLLASTPAEPLTENSRIVAMHAAATKHRSQYNLPEQELDEELCQQAQRWADLLRAEEKTLDATGLKTYHEWIRECVEADKPLNEWAAELISARGSTYKVPATNFFRALRTPEERAESTAQMMLGVRLTCAKCHNHPFDRWTQDDYYGWSNFFARIDYEIIENKRRDKSDKHEFVGEQIVKIKPEGEVTNVRTGKPAGLPNARNPTIEKK